MTGEKQETITRRHFLKKLGAVGATVIAAPVISSAESLFSPEQQQPFPLPGDFLPHPKKLESQNKSQEITPSALPKKENEERIWRKENPTNMPPAAYRSAMAWDEKNQCYILHGGYTGISSHNETWSYQNGDWKKIEQGSTPPLHGHKIVDTPYGLVMFGGVKPTTSNQYVDSNEFFCFTGTTWEKLIPETSGIKIPGLQGMGMVYNPELKSIWIMGGASGSDVFLSDVTFELMLPGVWSTESGWYFRGVGNQGNLNINRIFEPLAFTLPSNPEIYLYGGCGYDQGGGVGVFSNSLWQIKTIATAIEVSKANWPLVDFAGAIRGGFDNKHNQLLLHSGRQTYFFGSDYKQSVVFEKANNSWAKISSVLNPPATEKPATALNPNNSELLCFGGASWDGSKWIFSNDTWRCNYNYKIYLPTLQKP